MIRHRWFTVASVILLLVFAAAILFALAARGEMRWLREKFAEEQLAVFQENTQSADRSQDPRELASFLAATKFYYPSGTKQIPGTPLDRTVEAARSKSMTAIIVRLRLVTGRDLGSDPDAWLSEYGESAVKTSATTQNN